MATGTGKTRTAFGCIEELMLTQKNTVNSLFALLLVTIMTSSDNS